MFKKIFVDANILVDFIDVKRATHKESEKVIIGSLDKGISLCTSCDITTTVYYLSAKSDKKRALREVSKISRFCDIIDFSNKEVDAVCALMEEDGDYADLEDTLQYILAKKEHCDAIVTNDEKFVAKEIKLLSAQAFIKEANL